MKESGGCYSIKFVPGEEKMVIGGWMMRIFAFSLMALMLSVSSLAAACDLFCGFATSWSDCHATWKEALDSEPDAANMGGMAMPGMVMIDAVSADQAKVSYTTQGILNHAGLGDMSTCERQSCAQSQASAAQANRWAASHFDSIFAIDGFPRVHYYKSNFRHARDDVAPDRAQISVPLGVSLRI